MTLWIWALDPWRPVCNLSPSLSQSELSEDEQLIHREPVKWRLVMKAELCYRRSAETQEQDQMFKGTNVSYLTQVRELAVNLTSDWFIIHGNHLQPQYEDLFTGLWKIIVLFKVEFSHWNLVIVWSSTMNLNKKHCALWALGFTRTQKPGAEWGPGPEWLWVHLKNLIWVIFKHTESVNMQTCWTQLKIRLHFLCFLIFNCFNNSCRSWKNQTHGH